MDRRTRLRGWIIAAAAMTLASAPAHAAPCDGLLFDPADVQAAKRPLTPVDLVRLRDIGTVPGFSDPIFTLSPDRRMMAFQVRRADPETNSFCLGIAVAPVQFRATARLIDTGGDLIRWSYGDLLGKAFFPTGFPKVITPRWFPDGRSVAFLKRAGPTVQIWRASIDGDKAAPLTQNPVDILDFRIIDEGRTIVFVASPALRKARGAIAREGDTGFHYDDRFYPIGDSIPYPAPPIPTEVYTLDVASLTVRAASQTEQAAIAAARPGEADQGAERAASGDGREAWIQPARPGAFPPEGQIVASDRSGSVIACAAPACIGVETPPWWSADRRRVRFMRQEGWAKADTAIYEWVPGKATPKRLYATADLLAYCTPLADDLICVEEGSTTPRRLVRLELGSGAATTLLDLNPEFARLELGRVERLKWRSSAGIECFGDLVYPVGYRPGVRYPLIVVQYTSRGFLRGGTGDEYPVQAFANRGFAVLNIERPRSPADYSQAQSYADFDKADLQNFIDRRHVVSAIEKAVESLISRGLVDRSRVGITGLSDGSTTVQFAALHSSLFSAASISSCCWEASGTPLLGPAVARIYAYSGWPPSSRDDDAFWGQISWVRNATKLRLPVLVQTPDSEFRAALETYAALKDAKVPIDLYVFPDETHIKWQPAHRLAVYRRNLAWFDFWLNGRTPPDQPGSAEAARWQDMARAARDGGGATAAKPGE